MNAPSTNAHAGWFRDVRDIIDVTEITPGLPLPHIGPGRATCFFVGITHAADAVQAVRDAETVLSYTLKVTFVPRWTETGTGRYVTRHYILTAALPSGLMLDLVALAEHFDGLDAREDVPVMAGAA